MYVYVYVLHYFLGRYCILCENIYFRIFPTDLRPSLAPPPPRFNHFIRRIYTRKIKYIPIYFFWWRTNSNVYDAVIFLCLYFVCAVRISLDKSLTIYLNIIFFLRGDECLSINFVCMREEEVFAYLYVLIRTRARCCKWHIFIGRPKVHISINIPNYVACILALYWD